MQALVAVLTVVPFLSAAACLLFRSAPVRSGLVVATGGALILCSLLLIPHVPFAFSPLLPFGISLHRALQLPDFVLMLTVLGLGIRERSRLVTVLAGVQILLVTWLEVFQIRGHTAPVAIHCDVLALTLVLLISIVGSIVCFQAIAYMRAHEAHLGLKTSRQPRFFAVMLAFLGTMNAMVLANDLTVFHFFFELTTLCSYLLIGHDRTETATRNAVRALWMNTLGCVVFVVGMIVLDHRLGTLDLQEILRAGSGAPLAALALLCVAAFIKSAQFPFQSWLLGAMVAPTPVSALLHSSTMVKVGVYLAIRLAPALHGTLLSQCMGVFGAVSFLAAAALAVGQSNGKKVLAYSTISNLGLIFACAGLGTTTALAAASLLIVFHAVVKALLFLCVGSIEQSIESRDIEDMRGLYARMPVTALLTVMGVIMMIMPPFGLVLGKWMAMEAAARTLPVIVTLALGSAFTVLYWARWAGTLMSDPFAGRFKRERQPVLTWGALVGLGAGAGALSVAAPWLYRWLLTSPAPSSPGAAYGVEGGALAGAVGLFPVLPLSVVALGAFLHALWALRGARGARIVPPYLSGIHTAEPQVFIGPMGRPVKAQAANYYLASLFGEERLTVWVNAVAGLVLIALLGSSL